MKQKNESYNSKKKCVLELLEDGKWMDVPTLARKASIDPVRRSYTYLGHLEGLDLIARGYNSAGKLYYRITARGMERLTWLRLESIPQPEGRASSGPLEPLIASILSEISKH
jgi:hypothetical protein